MATYPLDDDDTGTRWYDGSGLHLGWLTTVTPWVAVTVGGALGAGLRGWLSSAQGIASTIGTHAGIDGGPWSILVVNLAGSLVLGFVGARCQRHGWTSIKLLLGTGFCGGLTTYSSFAVTVAIMAGIHPHAGSSPSSNPGTALLYAALTILGCALWAWVGILGEKWTAGSAQ
ncbi:MAG: CrcB family protein [Bifidobacterium sp.]|nr:CrcB family protein [Bifidobacterium sp.]